MQYKKLFQDITFQADLIQKFLLLVFISAIISYSGCSDNPVDPDIGKGFEIYFLDDPNIKIKGTLDKDINSLKLKPVPWIYEKDIDFYDYSSHCIYLKEDKTNFVPSLAFLYDENYKEYTDRPFVVVSNKERIYFGYLFHYLYSNIFWTIPHIEGVDIKLYPIDVLHINWSFVFSKDKRNDEKVKNTLTSSSLYHAGLEIEITNIKLYRSDTSILEYKISIKNKDADNLLFLDPDKINTELFHYYNDGPYFLDSSNKKAYSSEYKKTKAPDPYYKWEPNWFTKIESGKTIERTVTLKGYPYIPNGNYLCQMQYDGPAKINKTDRTTPDGRYWIGWVQSKIASVTIGNGVNCKINNKDMKIHNRENIDKDYL